MCIFCILYSQPFEVKLLRSEKPTDGWLAGVEAACTGFGVTISTASENEDLMLFWYNQPSPAPTATPPTSSGLPYRRTLDLPVEIPRVLPTRVKLNQCSI